MNNKIIEDDSLKCMGCTACADICPKNCIKMVVTHNNLTAVVDSSKCIHCDLCKKVCQVNNIPTAHNDQKCYVAWSNKERDTSASGGLASAISEYIIRNSGVVIGCALENNRIRHILIDNENDIKKLKGSKYVKSKMEGVYNLIKKNKDKLICFIGTPCQVAGVRKYCDISKISMERIILVDLICHGTPNQYLLNDIVGNKELLGFRKGNTFTLRFREHPNDKYSLSYMLGFLNGLFYNEACYDCQYANSHRVGDITIGDFWGVQNVAEENLQKGVSLVLVNSRIGNSIFMNLDIHKEPRELEEAQLENPQLRGPADKHPNYEKFLDAYPQEGIKCLPKLLKKELFKEKIKSVVFSNKISGAMAVKAIKLLRKIR